MYAPDFVSVYSAQPITPHAGERLEPVMSLSNKWSNFFGKTLINYLQQPGVPQPQAAAGFDEYQDKWLMQGYGETEVLLTQEIFDEDTIRQTNIFSFHRHNLAFYEIWNNMINNGGNWDSEQRRRNAIQSTQNVVALNGLRHFMQKQRYVAILKGMGLNYFDPEIRTFTSQIEGFLNECDAAVSLCSVALHLPSSGFVPGPMQLEHHNPEHNADFIFWQSDRAVGVQVKSSVNRATVNRYDPKRVVLIDGKNDMANERMERINSKSTQLQRVNWAGLISAAHVMQMPLKDSSRLGFRDMNGRGRTILEYKMMARGALRGTKHWNQRAATIIGGRIQESL